MRIGRYEFGFIKPLKWHKYNRTPEDNPCGCTIWEFGFWFFTILRYECAGEADTRLTMTLPIATPGAVFKIQNNGQRPIIIEMPGSESVTLAPKRKKVFKAKPRKRRKKKSKK